MIDGKKHHIIITGTGRSGTTFLMKLLTRLGFDTGFDLNYNKINGEKAYFEECNAGLEYQGIGGDLPYIIKNPKLMWQLPELLKNNSVIIDHVIIPIRDLHAASESRRVNVKNAPNIKDPRNVPGGLEGVTDPQKQEEFFLEKYYNFSLFLSTFNIPVTLLQYPRLVSDSDYLYYKLSGVFKGIDKDEFENVFKDILNPNLIHKYNSYDIYFPDIYDDSLNISELLNNINLTYVVDMVKKNENQLSQINLNFRENQKLIQKQEKEIENLKILLEKKESVLEEQKVIIQQKDKVINEEIKELNYTIKRIKDNNEQKNRYMQDKIKDQQNIIINMKGDIQHRDNIINDMKGDIKHRDNIINNYINKLEQKERELFDIRNSHGYKLLITYYKIRDKIFPINSRRRLIIKLIFNLIFNKDSRRLLTKSNFKKGIYYLKKGNISSVLSKFENRIETERIEVNKNFSSSNISDNYFLKVLKGENKSVNEEISNITIDIVIPIYNALDYTKKCIESVYQNSDLPYNLILIDDSSTDENINQFLKELKSNKKPNNLKELKIIQNEKNLGFVGTVNKGISISKNHVILLNTDTEVPKNWLSRMVAPILRNKDIASVTPFSNSATICSFPNFCEDNELPKNLSVDQIDNIFMDYGSDQPIDLPTGVGFCMLLNRNVLNEIGMFDEETFGKGYGEENDWCMRAYKAGYRNVLIPNLFVFHKHGVSFNLQEGTKTSRIRENLIKLNDIHPEYEKLVHQFISLDPIKPIRTLLTSVVTSQENKEQKGILFINHGLGGGTTHYQETYINRIKDENRIYTMELKEDNLIISDRNYKSTFRYNLNIKDLKQDVFNNLLKIFKIDLIYINQLVTYPPLEVMNLIQNSNIKYIYFIHDYFCVCPSFNLIKSNGKYCHAQTDSRECQKCIERGLVTEPWVNLSSTSINIDAWRKNFEQFLMDAYKVLAPSESTKEIVNRYYPGVSIEVKEHDVVTPVKHTFDPQIVLEQEELNIGFIGAINESKGSDIIYDLSRRIKNEKLPINIKVIGVTNRHQNPYKSDDGRFEITGRYDNNKISELLRRHNISVVVIPAIWPETFSYTTSEAMLSGYPVITFNVGAPAERVLKYDAGWVLEEMNAESILTLVKKLMLKREELVSKSKQFKTNIK